MNKRCVACLLTLTLLLSPGWGTALGERDVEPTETRGGTATQSPGTEESATPLPGETGAPASTADETGTPAGGNADALPPRDADTPGATTPGMESPGADTAGAQLTESGLPVDPPAGKITPAPQAAPLPESRFTSNDRRRANGFTPLGVLMIPAIDVRETIVVGASSAPIKHNAGWLEGSADIGKPGNCIIAGHRNYSFGSMFNRLDELTVGDKVDIGTPDGALYRYTVFDAIIVKQKDQSYFDGDPNVATLMLVTCHPIVVSTHQLLIRARLETVVTPEGTVLECDENGRVPA